MREKEMQEKTDSFSPHAASARQPPCVKDYSGLRTRDQRPKLFQRMNTLKRNLQISDSMRRLGYYCRLNDPQRIPQ
jgi:hypothetical protein